jgi:hypothetical protein
MTLSHIVAATALLTMTSCPGQPFEIGLEPAPDPVASREAALRYVDRAAARHRMTPVFQSDLACRHAWRVEGKPRHGIFRRPLLLACADYAATGPLYVRLLYDGGWDDSTSFAARIRREFTDSLAQFGTLSLRDSLSRPLLRR